MKRIIFNTTFSCSILLQSYKPLKIKKFALPTKSTYFKSESLSSLEMFLKTIDFGNSVARLVGCSIFEPNFSPINFWLLVMLTDLVTYLLISIQNIYAFRDDFVRVIFVVVTLGMGFQSAIKLYTFIIQRERILKLSSLIQSFHESSNSAKSAEIFERWSLIGCHIIGLAAVLFYSCAVFVFCYPFLIYFFFGQKILPFGFIIPGLDWESSYGYFLNYAHHTFQIYGVINGLFITTTYIITFILNGFAQYEALEVLLEDLSVLAETNEDNENNEQIKTCIANLTDGHVILLEFVNYDKL